MIETPTPVKQRQLGELLVAGGLISDDQLSWALEVQRRTGSRLGAILVAAGLVRRRPLHQFLAQQWGIPYVEIAGEPLDSTLLAATEPDQLVREGWFPLRREADHVVVATATAPDDELRDRVEAIVARPVQFAATSGWDIVQGVQRAYRDELLDEASLGLWRRDEIRSARRVVYRAQAVSAAVVAAAVALGLVFATLFTLVVLVVAGSIGFLASVGFKFLVCLNGARHERDEKVSDDDVAALDAAELPVYTVLVPLFREAEVVGDLIGNLERLDYPAEKLEVLLLLEEGDVDTIAAARAAAPPDNFTFLIVPDGAPKTKPKACNVGLFYASGEFLVIFDAEDRPDPDQLKKAVIAFRRGDDRLACVQAALNYWNDEENVLTRMFTLEYSFWFDYMLPGLDHLKLPIPLGGTSNHFRTDVLRRLGGWDPYNVTEDADLGIRAAALGYTVGVINSTTYEEANRAAGNWIRQRSRWVKGYLQTILVHLRRPSELVRATGVRQAVAFALLVGGTPFTFLMAPPLWAVFAGTLLFRLDTLTQLFPGWALYLSLANLLAGNALMIYLSMMGAFKRRRYRLVAWSLLNPCYWVLHSIAAYKALWQLIVKPHYWEKTTHGISTLRPGPASAGGGLGAEPVAV